MPCLNFSKPEQNYSAGRGVDLLALRWDVAWCAQWLRGPATLESYAQSANTTTGVLGKEVSGVYSVWITAHL